ncbi:MAG: hypothetical protein H7Z42_22520 [Roseiflexaceae bacterium]|nr:hypothetical protein [Roseiflexaceae bacterium]
MTYSSGSVAQQAAALDAARSYGWLVLHYRIGQLEAMLAWLYRCADWVNQRTAVPLPYPPEWAELPVGQPTT